MPTSEDLLIIINGNIVTNMIAVDSITIINERGKRVSTATFTIDDGASLSLAQWQTVVIYEADMSVVHFNGFITELSSSKRAVFVDYNISCSSVEILLQKAIINGSFTGTDAEILAAMLAGAYPDISDMFDWSSGITPLSLADMNIDFQDLNLLDALDMLSARLDNAPYTQGYGAAVSRVNLIKNPALTNNMNHYNSDLIAGGWWASNGASAWNPANTVYNGSAGESGGGIVVTSQDLGGTWNHSGFIGIGRTAPANSYTNLFHINKADNNWFAMRVRVKVVSAGASINMRWRAVTYYENGTVYHDGTSIAPLDNVTSDGSWYTEDRAIDLSTAYIPDSGWIEIQLDLSDPVDTFVATVDSFLFELLYNVGEPTAGAYFDGNTANAYWLGAVHGSASATGANELEWGTSPNAAFDIDIDSGGQLFDDLEIDFPGMDGINSVIVTGGYEWEAVDRIYQGNGVRTTWDIESPIYPSDTLAQPVIYRNIGTDAVPNWSVQTVATRQAGFDAGTVLYDLEDHWVEFASAAVDLNKAWRIVGRIKKRIRTVVTDDTNIAATGQEFTGTIYNENITSAAEAYDLGQAELERRAPDPSVKFTTYTPGLVAGAEIDIADSVQSFSDTLIIERVTRTYLGGGKGKFAVEAGRMPVGIDDIIVETHGLAEPKVPIDQGTDTLTVNLIVDDDAALMVDDDALQIIDTVVV